MKNKIFVLIIGESTGLECLKVALKKDPKNTSKILSKIYKDDKKISNIAKKILKINK